MAEIVFFSPVIDCKPPVADKLAAETHAMYGRLVFSKGPTHTDTRTHTRSHTRTDVT